MVSSIYKWSPQRVARQEQPSKEALADLARRKAAPDTRDNTGRLLGDPPPGRSALDKKRQAEERKRLGWPEEVHELLEELSDEDDTDE